MGRCCPRRKGTGSYEGARSCRNSEGLGPVGIWFRLGPVTRLFDLSAPEQSLRVQDDGQQCGNEIDGRGTRNRP